MAKTERALGADEQVAQVVAGIVFAQTAHAIPDVSAWQHDFEAEGEFACISIAQDLRAAGVRTQVAADRGAALGSQRQRKQPAGAVCRLLHVVQHAAGFDGKGAVDGVDFAHTMQALQRQHDGIARCIGGRATHEPGVAALRNDRGVMFSARANDRRHFAGRCGEHDCLRTTRETATPIG